jgi:hypothetical protein
MTRKPTRTPTRKATTAAATSKCPDSERAKVPGIVLRLKDMQNPCVLARMRGVFPTWIGLRLGFYWVV